MRKLILTVTVALLTSGVSVFAAENIHINNADEIVVVINNDDFKEISAKELPAAVSSAIIKNFPSAIVNKLYVNGNEQYKIDLTIDETDAVVYADKEGNWIEDTDLIVVE